jgi:hypothetical protein
MKYFFKNFLQDHRVYTLNEAYYKRLLKSVTGNEVPRFFQSRYADGQKIYDDHIFSAKYNDRILQIIQREPVSKKPFLRARVQKWDGQYDMLVLSLELSSEIKPALKKIIRAWLVEKALGEEVKGMVEER